MGYMKAGQEILCALLLLLAYNSSWSQLGSKDTLYIVPVNTILPVSGPGEVEFQFRFKTDNGPLSGAIQAYLIIFKYTVNNPSANIHLVEDSVYAFQNTASEAWEGRSIFDSLINDTTGLFVIGAVSFGPYSIINGDFNVGNIKFLVSDTATIRLDTTHTGYGITDFATELAMYIPVYWQPSGYTFKITRQPPAVPTLSRFGLVIFALLLVAGLVYFLRSHRFTISGKETRGHSPG